ncbi:MAG: hypothetical protein CBD49_00955 [Acidimicrobiaceae bacterium TMED189]|nr:MAG: hypothetical protein CBD49_00955 [Acidimicrobiaceae bacterium TMED189]
MPKGVKPSWLPVCDGVCDGVRKNRCHECWKYYRKHAAGGHASRGPVFSPQPTLIDQIRLNPHLDWTERQRDIAGIE